jgi:hypothetical protein
VRVDASNLKNCHKTTFFGFGVSEPHFPVFRVVRPMCNEAVAKHLSLDKYLSRPRQTVLSERDYSRALVNADLSIGQAIITREENNLLMCCVLGMRFVLQSTTIHTNKFDQVFF